MKKKAFKITLVTEFKLDIFFYCLYRLPED